MKILNEELNKMKLMMKYDNKFTLSENFNLINENKSIIQDFLGSTKLMGKVFEDLKATESFKSIKEVDDIAYAIKNAGNLKSAMVGDLISVLKRQSGLPSNLKAELSSSIRGTSTFSNLYKKSINTKDWVTLERQLKTSQTGKGVKNYSDEMVQQIMNDLKTDSSVIKDAKISTNEISKVVKQKEVAKVAEQVGMTKEEINAWFKENTQVAKNPGYFNRLWTKIKNAGKIDKETRLALKRQGFMKWDPKMYMWRTSWKKVIMWAVVATVGANYLVSWLKKQGIFVDVKEDVNKIDDSNNGGNTGGDTGGSNTGGGTNYTACTDFPYKKGCSSTIVAEVQKCLGLPDDGKFGPKTEDKLKELGYGTEITQDVYNKIKEKCGTSGTTTSTTLPAPEFQDLEVDPDSITI
jgi:hypothetical protein